MQVLVVGSIALDTVETPAQSVVDSPGGSALYFSSAASLFTPVNIVGVVGSDFDFNTIEFLKKRRVSFEGIYTQPGKTFRWGGRYHANPNMRDSLFTHLNVFENFQPTIPDSYKKSSFIFLANIAPELQLQVLEQVNNPQLVILDTMNFWISRNRKSLLEVIARTNVLIVNDEETRELTGEQNIIAGGRRILEMGPQYLIIKKGEHGAVLMAKEAYFCVPAFPVENVLDPTGAGDSFAGGFVGYLACAKKIDEQTMRKAVIYGSAVASFSVEDFSFKRLISLTKKDLDKRVRRFKDITRF